MFINITDSETGNNKGCCGQLVNYLEKENRTAIKEDNNNELWFNNVSNEISPQEVRIKIDNNIAKLGRNDAKFFLVNISPSQKEIAYLKEKFGATRAEEKLKEYAACVMDAYAGNFKRSGIKSGKDLVWYAKLERNRYYSYNDPEVKEGTAKVGEAKEGEQMHVQVIVSRKDRTNKSKMSSMNNSRGSNKEHSAKIGQFNRVVFKNSGEQIFDQMFDYNRSLKDSMGYALTMKNGNAEQKRTVNLLDQLEKEKTGRDSQSLVDIARNIYRGDTVEWDYLLDGLNSRAPDFKGHDDSLSSLIESFGGLVPEAQGEDYEEQNFANKIRKRKRRPPGI